MYGYCMQDNVNTANFPVTILQEVFSKCLNATECSLLDLQICNHVIIFCTGCKRIVNNRHSSQKLKANDQRQTANISRQTPPCKERYLQKMQSLLRSRMSALQDSAMKSRNVELPFEKWTQIPSRFFQVHCLMTLSTATIIQYR